MLKYSPPTPPKGITDSIVAHWPPAPLTRPVLKLYLQITNHDKCLCVYDICVHSSPPFVHSPPSWPFFPFPPPSPSWPSAAVGPPPQHEWACSRSRFLHVKREAFSASVACLGVRAWLSVKPPRTVSDCNRRFTNKVNLKWSDNHRARQQPR